MVGLFINSFSLSESTKKETQISWKGKEKLQTLKITGAKKEGRK